jgi:hypothetical protein
MLKYRYVCNSGQTPVVSGIATFPICQVRTLQKRYNGAILSVLLSKVLLSKFGLGGKKVRVTKGQFFSSVNTFPSRIYFKGFECGYVHFNRLFRRKNGARIQRNDESLQEKT